MNKMKRGLNHQSLLHEYLELQKDFVSKKKKLQIAKEKKETLLAEVRFLRARYGYLSEILPYEAEIEHEPIQAQNVSKKGKNVVKNSKTFAKEKNNIKRFAKNRNSNSLPIMENENEDGENLLVRKKSPSEEKKMNNCSINGKKAGKKKISWQEPVALAKTPKIAPTMAM